KLFTPQVLLERLEGRLGDSPLSLLTAGARDLPARHQTLWAAIDWSYDLIDSAEQMLFLRLGVFVGSFTVAAAASVLGLEAPLQNQVLGHVEWQLQSPELGLLDRVASLLDQSLLQQVEGTAPQGHPEPRFAMLETIREYALKRLELSGEGEALRQ